MIVPGPIRACFFNAEPHVKAVGDRVKSMLLPFCEEHGYAFVSRFKTLESIAEKIESGRYRSWSDLDDLYAATIVIPTLSDEAAVITFLDEEFKRAMLRSRDGAKKAPEVFRFDATRWLGSLRSTSATEMATEIAQVKFEIQIRTAFEHAWSVTTHALTYKSDTVDWRRQRLAAQLKAAVEQLDLLVLAFDSAIPQIQPSQWNEISLKERIVKAFREHLAHGRLPEELCPQAWSRFADNVYALLRASNRKPVRDDRMEQIVDRALSDVNAALREMTINTVPRSLSLYQFVLGILSEHGVVTSALDDGFTPNVTPELEAFFPATKKLHRKFAYPR